MKLNEELSQRGKPPTDKEIADILGVTEYEIANAIIEAYINDENMNKTLSKMTENIISERGKLPLVFAGGVMSNSIISKSLTERFGATFASPELSSDNAVGIAVLTALQHKF